MKRATRKSSIGLEEERSSVSTSFFLSPFSLFYFILKLFYFKLFFIFYFILFYKFCDINLGKKFRNFTSLMWRPGPGNYRN